MTDRTEQPTDHTDTPAPAPAENPPKEEDDELTAHIKAIVDHLPPFTDEERARLERLLRPRPE